MTAAPGGPGASSAGARDGGGGATPLLHGLAVFMALWTFALLFVGGLVTSREAGLSVPDWPLSYGAINPPGWTTTPNVNVEHGHRLLGWVIGMLVIVLAAWIQVRERRRWMRILGWAALAFVILQGVVGGYFRVVLLQHNMAIVHGVLGQGFFCLVVALALFTSRGWREAPAPVESPDASRMHRKALLAAVAVFVQVVVGALVRHSRVGHSVPHVAPHALFALVVAHLSVSAMVLALGGCGPVRALRTPAVILGAGVILQLMLGLGAYFANTKGVEEITRPPYQFWTATLHQAAGALVLAAAVVLYLRSRLLLAAPGSDRGAREGAAGAARPAGGAA